jgi:hypothetical protein
MKPQPTAVARNAGGADVKKNLADEKSCGTLWRVIFDALAVGK